MKIYVYTTLLTLFTCFLFPSIVISQEKDKKIESNSMIAEGQEGVMSHDVRFDKEVVEELDSLLRNGVGLKRVNEGGKSILKMELDPSTKASLSMFGCIDVGQRAALVGKAKPDPRIGSIKTNRKRIAKEQKTDLTALAIAENLAAEKSSASVAPRTSTQLESELAGPVISKNQDFRDTANRQFRTMNISLVDNMDKSLLKKYSLVLGAFRSLNNADFVKRTFNALGEKVFVVRSTTGVYYALLLGTDNQDDIIKLYDSFGQKYTQGVSRTKRISRYGIPLDDLWILIKD